MALNIRSLARRLIVVVVALTPILSVGELLSLLQGSIQSQVIVSTPFYIKLIKDFFVVAVMCIGVVHMLRSGRTNRLAVPFLVLLAYTGIVAVSGSDSVTLALAGIRWIMPVFLPFLLYDFVDEQLLQRLARVLGWLLVLEVVLQVAELYFMSHWYGAIVFGLAARVPGFFVIPVTAGFFALITLFFAVFFERSNEMRRAVYVLAPISLALTQSGTGLVVLVLMVTVISLGVRRIWLMLPLGAALMILIFPLLPLLTGRPADYVAVSGGTRIEIFRDLLSKSEWIPSAFGYVTNTAVSLLANGALNSNAIPTIVDSTYSSVWGNLGIPGGIFFGLFIASWMIAVIGSRRLDLYVATGIFVLYGFTTILFETFPMNILLAVCAAFFLRNSYMPFWTGQPARPRGPAVKGESGHTQQGSLA